MTGSPSRYPDLRASIELVLETVGYRLPYNATVNVVAQNAFRCSKSGVTRRLNGEIQVGPADMSRLAQQTTIARDGIVPAHFHHGPEKLKQILRDRGVGLYGRSVGSRLHRAVRDFAGERGKIQVRIGLPRAGGFVWDPKEAQQRLLVLRPRDPLHFACHGPIGFPLLLLDHAPDAGVPDLLVPAIEGDWPELDASGRTYFPGRDDTPLYVRPDLGVRQVVALWLPKTAASAIDSAVPASEEAFRPVPETVIAKIMGCLQNGSGQDRARAVADVFYRSSET
ncbi:hypothetical protein ACSSV8_003721 [Roseovarius sp. MBR-79]|jgi:hypothetical protein